MSDAHPLEKVIAAYGEAWNSHDIEAILAMHTEDSVFENHTSGGKGVGKQAIREILKGVFATFPDIRFEARRAYVRDGLVTQEWTATGTLAIPYTSGGTTVQPTGRKVSWNGVDVIPFVGSRVARKDVYVDSIGFLRALGFSRISL
ncbi:MAG TPA: nuclear transport factor 2 family protein [Vicinamibacterales bacterium]|nr:nuclear transport factor 2 family protein [Vicinamibacterales bacterium]